MTSQSDKQAQEIVARRLCMAADVEKYSRLDTPGQTVVQADLVQVLEEAAVLSGLDRAGWARQPQGDQEFAVLPLGTPEPVMLGAFIRHLAARLDARNAGRAPKDRMRLRLAIDMGVASPAALGHSGPAPIAVARYLNAPQVKKVLEGIGSTDLVVIVSGRLYEDVVKSRIQSLDLGQYVRVHIRQKEFSDYGWIHVPGHGADELRPIVEAVSEPQKDSPPVGLGSDRHDHSQHVQEGVAFRGDVVGNVSFGLPSGQRKEDVGESR
ncbi:hypothetical protein OK074_5328 [Actinobacteria bacterium OK074]|nr:hypothetical protein OK074_5328 [Actinobacteria bacterium OK074]